MEMMEYDAEKREIYSDKIINELDKFVIDFVSILERCKIGYVIVSGYVSIILGRSRATEDVDMFIVPMDFLKFRELFDYLLKCEYECINTSIPEEAFEMIREHGIRFFKKGRPIPNIEFKIIKRATDKYSFDNKITLFLRKANKHLFISPLEIHIAFKLLLAADGTDEELRSDKDIEDARFAYKLFNGKINKDELSYWINEFDVRGKFKWIK